MTMALDHSIDISDDALLQLYANGDQVAARQLTLRLAPRAYKQAYRMLVFRQMPKMWHKRR